ncbi:hypothetical protein ABW19_dt0210241 [Dactylella cylindrospora]|nr:hypothetical protein ABW19_dt0210241 [Dactylella cylindrospora]
MLPRRSTQQLCNIPHPLRIILRTQKVLIHRALQRITKDILDIVMQVEHVNWDEMRHHRSPPFLLRNSIVVRQQESVQHCRKRWGSHAFEPGRTNLLRQLLQKRSIRHVEIIDFINRQNNHIRLPFPLMFQNNAARIRHPFHRPPKL